MASSNLHAKTMCREERDLQFILLPSRHHLFETDRTLVSTASTNEVVAHSRLLYHCSTGSHPHPRVCFCKIEIFFFCDCCASGLYQLIRFLIISFLHIDIIVSDF